MKKALIIGAAGFVGKYLINQLQSEDIETAATKLPTEQLDLNNTEIIDLDILDKEAIVKVLFEVKPDYIFHLAAQSSVGLSWKNPKLTVNVNIQGAINVMEAVKELYYKPRVLMVGSGEEYGHIQADQVPIKENIALNPGNIYAATKACQNMLSRIYADAYDMDLIMTRSFNHMGPGQLPLFVVSDFCKQVAEIEKGIKEPVIRVGNLSAKRDFTDVRDVVKAYTLLVKEGKRGNTYNVGSGDARAIQDILDIIISLSDVKISVEVDPNKIRPVDVPIIEADITKINEETGWKPLIPIETTLKETLDYWRNNV